MKVFDRIAGKCPPWFLHYIPSGGLGMQYGVRLSIGVDFSVAAFLFEDGLARSLPIASVENWIPGGVEGARYAYSLGPGRPVDFSPHSVRISESAYAAPIGILIFTESPAIPTYSLVSTAEDG